MPKRVLSWWWSTLTIDRRLEQAIVGEARLLRAVDGDEDPLGRVRRHVAQKPAALQVEKRVLARAAAPLLPATMTLSLPSSQQRQVHREQRSERVAVGVLVRGDEEAVAGRERVDDGFHVSRLCHR